MKTAKDRYQTDPYFHQLVDLFVSQFMEWNKSGAGLTPSEIREASGFAWQIYMERYGYPAMQIHTGGLGES